MEHEELVSVFHIVVELNRIFGRGADPTDRAV